MYYVCVHEYAHLSASTQESQKKASERAPGAGVGRLLIWVLRAKIRSFARVARALNKWAISLVLPLQLKDVLCEGNS